MFSKISFKSRERIIFILKVLFSFSIVLLYSFIMSSMLCAFFGLDLIKIFTCLFVGVYFFPLSAVKFFNCPFFVRKDNN